jgi:hypothetical protein
LTAAFLLPPCCREEDVGVGAKGLVEADIRFHALGIGKQKLSPVPAEVAEESGGTNSEMAVV